MIVCVPVMADGLVDPRWGRADRVALATVSDAAIDSWEESDVGWDALHDSGPEGAHHARIARFLRGHEVEVVVAGHMGRPMENMLRKMGIEVQLGAAGNAREAVLRALSARSID
jgi:predicted Fe-Mo cluster-binding NifX family protein